MPEAIKSYLERIKNIPVLTPKEEKDLARKIKKGNRYAKKKMIESNLKLVVNIAKRYAGLGLPLMDLIAEGNLGLMRAVERFNPRKGFRFSTYAAWWIRQAITRAIIDQAKTVRIPVYLTEIISRIKKAQENLRQKLGRDPTSKELARHIKIPSSRLDRIQLLMAKTASLETPIGDDKESQFQEVLKDEKDLTTKEINRFVKRQELLELMEGLTPREREILDLRFGLKDEKNYTLAKISKKMNISRERVRQIEEKALKKLRKLMEEEG